MKKVILALLFSGSAVAAMSQVSLGLKAGANITNFTGGDFDAVKKKAIVGFHGGGYLNVALGALSLQPEVMVSTQGARIDSVSGSYDWKVTYLTVDVKNETIDAFAKNLDLSAGAGIGFQTKGGFGIGGRYLVGLSKVGDFDASNSGGIDPDFKNSVIQLGIFFKLSK